MRISERQLELKPEEKICIAYITDCDDTLDETNKRTTPRTSAIASTLYNVEDVMTFDTKIKGVSKCHDDDEFDEHKAVDLANTRADMKYHRRMAKDYQKYINACEKAIEEFKALQKMHENKVKNIEEDIRTYYIEGTKK